MSLIISDFAVLSPNEKNLLESFGTVLYHGSACSTEKDPSEDEMIRIVSKDTPDILIVNSAPVTSKVIDAMPNVRLIICARGNPVNVDVAYCNQKNIPVTHTPGRNANAVAEYTLCMILCALRNVFPATHAVMHAECTVAQSPESLQSHTKDVTWMHDALPYEPYYEFSGYEITDKTLGLIGFGFIGQCVAKKAHALGMHVIAYDPHVSADVFQKHGVTSVDLDTVTRTSDVISLHAVATGDCILTKERLQTVKKHAVIINTARSSLIDTKALLDALKQKKIHSAVLDVFDYEPLSSFDPMISEPINGLILSPHIAGASKDVAICQSKMILEAVQAFCEKKELPYQAKA
ncbi:MAG: NAD(P)-dependent oxidoreductase [Spirochaetales bacterium]